MIEKFIEQYAKLITKKPELVNVARVNLNENHVEIIVYVSKADIGRLIGRDGKIINALKTLITGLKAKQPTAYKISVKTIDE